MKHTSMLIRAALLLLSLCMMVGVFAACTTEGGQSNATGNNAGNNGTQAPGTTEDLNLDADGYWKDFVPDGLNYGDSCLILAASNQKTHFYAEESETGNVQQAIFNRNATVEERLGIEFEWNMQPCYATADKNAFAQMVETDIQTGNEIDVVVCYNLVPYTLANKGMLLNLAKTEYIDLTQPWWPGVFLDTMLYKDQIFALVDNASVGTLSNLSAIYFNNELIEDKNLPSPYDLVAANEWTLEKLAEITKDTYEDRNNNGKKDAEDFFGVATSTYARVTCWYYGAGVRFSELNAEGELVLTAGNVEDISNRVAKIAALFETNDGLINDSKQYIMFNDERVIFYLSNLGLSTNMINSNVDIDYGVAPNPKYNSEQEKYYTHCPNTHDAWCIPFGVKLPDCSSAVIELMASEAYRQVNHVYYETNLKVRYAPDDRLAQMYDLIRESMTFDFVYIYNTVMGADCDNQIRACIKSPQTSQWSTVWAQYGNKISTGFQQILDTYALREGQ